MEDVARDLNVSRATLYRVVGSRDRLLGDVFWQLARRTLDLAIQQVDATGLTGPDRLLQISRHFHEEVGQFRPLQKFLQQEPSDAFRVLFTASGEVHQRMVAAWADLLQDAVDTGQLTDLPCDAQETAFMFVRLGESILYGDMLAGIVPHGELTERLRRMILCGR